MSLSFSIGKILGGEGDVDRNDFFNILGCSENSTEEQIVTEYRIRALKCHPDKNPGNQDALQEFQRLQEARDTLTSPELRPLYDKWRHSEMCIPFKTWLNMHNRCATTMHWAKPREQTMLENGHSSKRGLDDPDLQEFVKKDAPLSMGSDITRGSRNGWESDDQTNVYSQFRNYKI
ncbi:J domain-containing protein [Folsomia candida]|uniref:J domain-containing protein n=1 Tax=Folsomia candida TaxID=158441 RepID=A0A226E5J0_FOLCA|nr:J domain-containing protein [Folsomia candida]OXA52699.1 J domain-containing protein [Folsomia candida]